MCLVESLMSLPVHAALMRIYTDEAARHGRKALFEAIVLEARDAGIAGATVLRGPMGFGEASIIHNAGILNLSSSLPLVIELVDAEDKLRAYFKTLATHEIGLVTLEKVEVLHHGQG
jgi:PII-like signaling protein